LSQTLCHQILRLGTAGIDERPALVLDTGDFRVFEQLRVEAFGDMGCGTAPTSLALRPSSAAALCSGSVLRQPEIPMRSR
jgi:hypothetical protein